MDNFLQSQWKSGSRTLHGDSWHLVKILCESWAGITVFLCWNPGLATGLQRQIHGKITASKQDFSNMTSDWLAICCQPIINHVRKLLLNNMDFNMEISLTACTTQDYQQLVTYLSDGHLISQWMEWSCIISCHTRIPELWPQCRCYISSWWDGWHHSSTVPWQYWLPLQPGLLIHD